jgi:hypothetical protein
LDKAGPDGAHGGGGRGKNRQCRGAA